RLKITKEGGLRFISHLEYMRTLERAVRRAKLPAAWTEGFNPHMKLSLASALGLGIESLSEYAELELAAPLSAAAAAAALNAKLPRGIRALAADVVEKAPKLAALLAMASYTADMPEGFPAESINRAAAGYNEAPEFFCDKKTAPGKPARRLDLKKYTPAVTCENLPGRARLCFDCLITAAGSVRAHDLIDALNSRFGLGLDILAVRITRTGLYREGREPLITGPTLSDGANPPFWWPDIKREPNLPQREVSHSNEGSGNGED
ncbi:MAG: TIGR03936 family radical SAM-associated protein, partial [Acidaminococcales bacterium]|nr:TIGR03936 family radical SAM-associated protein [Acidaminococcales bacterium]